jgi:hypothetical protein
VVRIGRNIKMQHAGTPAHTWNDSGICVWVAKTRHHKGQRECPLSTSFGYFPNGTLSTSRGPNALGIWLFSANPKGVWLAHKSSCRLAPEDPTSTGMPAAKDNALSIGPGGPYGLGGWCAHPATPNAYSRIAAAAAGAEVRVFFAQ